MSSETFGAIGYERMDEDASLTPATQLTCQQAQPTNQPTLTMVQTQQMSVQPVMVQATTAQGQPSQTIMVQPNQPIILNYAKPTKPRIKTNYKSKMSNMLAYIVIICGILDIILQGIGYGLQIEKRKYFSWDDADAYYTWFGVWCGICIIVFGSIAIATGKTRHICLIISTLIMSIFGTFLSLIVIGLAAWAVSHDTDSSPYWNNYAGYGSNTRPPGYAYILQKQDELIQGSLSVGTLLIVSGVVSFVCFILSSALCCAVGCCCVSDPYEDCGQVLYLSHGNQGASGLVQNPPQASDLQCASHGQVEINQEISTQPAVQTTGNRSTSIHPNHEH